MIKLSVTVKGLKVIITLRVILEKAGKMRS